MPASADQPPQKLDSGKIAEGIGTSDDEMLVSWCTLNYHNVSSDSDDDANHPVLRTAEINTDSDEASLEIIREVNPEGGSVEVESFFPDNRRVLATSYAPHDTHVLEMDTITGAATRRTDGIKYDEGEDVGPNGRFATIETARHTTDAGNFHPALSGTHLRGGYTAGGANLDIEILALDGSGDRRRLSDATWPPFHGDEDYYFNEPSFSPDGRKIAYIVRAGGGPWAANVESDEKPDDLGLYIMEFDCPPQDSGNQGTTTSSTENGEDGSTSDTTDSTTDTVDDTTGML